MDKLPKQTHLQEEIDMALKRRKNAQQGKVNKKNDILFYPSDNIKKRK